MSNYWGVQFVGVVSSGARHISEAEQSEGLGGILLGGIPPFFGTYVSTAGYENCITGAVYERRASSGFYIN